MVFLKYQFISSCLCYLAGKLVYWFIDSKNSGVFVSHLGTWKLIRYCFSYHCFHNITQMPIITLTSNSYYESNMNNAVREYRGRGKRGWVWGYRSWGKGEGIIKEWYLSEAVPGREVWAGQKRCLFRYVMSRWAELWVWYPKGIGPRYTWVACSSVLSPNQVYMLFFFNHQFATQKNWVCD